MLCQLVYTNYTSYYLITFILSWLKQLCYQYDALILLVPLLFVQNFPTKLSKLDLVATMMFLAKCQAHVSLAVSNIIIYFHTKCKYISSQVRWCYTYKVMYQIFWYFHFLNIVCDWNIEVNKCIGFCEITSPGFPGIYPPHTACTYKLMNKEGERVELYLSGMNSRLGGKFDIKRR